MAFTSDLVVEQIAEVRSFGLTRLGGVLAYSPVIPGSVTFKVDYEVIIENPVAGDDSDVGTETYDPAYALTIDYATGIFDVQFAKAVRPGNLYVCYRYDCQG